MAIKIDSPTREPRLLLVVTPKNEKFGKQVQAELITWLQAELTTPLVELYCGDVKNAATAIDCADIILLITQTGDMSEALKLKGIARVAVQVGTVVWFFPDTSEQKALLKDYALVTIKSSNLGLGSWIHLRLTRSAMLHQALAMRAVAAAAKEWDVAGRPRELLLEQHSIPV